MNTNDGIQRKGPGPPPNLRKLKFQREFSLGPTQTARLTADEMDTLERCADDSARRLFLGVGERGPGGEFERRYNFEHWMPEFALQPLKTRKPRTMPMLPKKKPVMSVGAGDIRVERMMELARRLA